jgi:hypothetical protein
MDQPTINGGKTIKVIFLDLIMVMPAKTQFAFGPAYDYALVIQDGRASTDRTSWSGEIGVRKTP